MSARTSRRRFLVRGLLALGSLAISGCGRVMRWMANADNSEFSPTSYSFETSNLCALNAEAIRGPFYVSKTLLRREIAEDHLGAALRLNFQVVDVEGCQPIDRAVVEIWHCDAEGAYSAYPSYPPDEFPMVDPEGFYEPENAERFCRGVQFTDASGFVEFETIVPGWYIPRTPHIHVRVSMPGSAEVAIEDERVVLTNQVYFPDEITAPLFATRAPYKGRGPSPYTNTNDSVIHASEGADGGYLHVTREGDGFLGTITLGVEA
jgi:protocatechuate 3,4-dioxygenase beta subunit